MVEVRNIVHRTHHIIVLAVQDSVIYKTKLLTSFKIRRIVNSLSEWIGPGQQNLPLYFLRKNHCWEVPEKVRTRPAALMSSELSAFRFSIGVTPEIDCVTPGTNGVTHDIDCVTTGTIRSSMTSPLASLFVVLGMTKRCWEVCWNRYGEYIYYSE